MSQVDRLMRETLHCTTHACMGHGAIYIYMCVGLVCEEDYVT